jgi:hypothetical protein
MYEDVVSNRINEILRLLITLCPCEFSTVLRDTCHFNRNQAQIIQKVLVLLTNLLERLRQQLEEFLLRHFVLRRLPLLAAKGQQYLGHVSL